MNASVVVGSVLVLLGAATIVVAVLRTLTHAWTFGAYEIWVLPLVGAGLLLLGRWALQ